MELQAVKKTNAEDSIRRKLANSESILEVLLLSIGADVPPSNDAVYNSLCMLYDNLNEITKITSTL